MTMARTSVHIILDLMVSMRLLVMVIYVWLLEFEEVLTGCGNLPFVTGRSRTCTIIIGIVSVVGTHKAMFHLHSVCFIVMLLILLDFLLDKP
jgi:hypothetical protein